jgi:4-hydroxy 2-oxovalerate aldolase
MKKIMISDPTLRDGNHAIKHQLSKEQVAIYCQAAEAAHIPVIEVGHGNGLGASSMQVGLAKESDETLLATARENLKVTKLGVHVIPGFATCERDIKKAVDCGVDLFRVASHCTEADITRKHIAYARDKGKEVYGVLMMSHMATVKVLVEEAQKMQSYGAEAIVIMDSSGHYMPIDVEERITALRAGLKIDVGFHGHNNLGMAVINSLVAANCGATILDACSRGFGAGAGNTQLEVLVAVLEKEGYLTGIDLYGALDCGDIAEQHLIERLPKISSTSVVSGLAGVFSGFAKHVEREAMSHGVDPRDIFFRLGERKVVAGQEDVIVEVAIELAGKKKK